MENTQNENNAAGGLSDLTAVLCPNTPWGALSEVIGCFDAAIAEGLHDALRDTRDERLKDLIERRLIYALYAAQAVDGIDTAAKRVFEVMGHDHQMCWEELSSAQREFYVCVAKAAVGA